MEIYFYIYFSLLFFAFKDRGTSENDKLFKYIFVFFAGFLAVRYKVGNDYIEYYRSFLRITEGSYDSYFEPGFILFYKVFNSPEVFLAVLSIMSMYLLYVGFKYFSTSYQYISLLVYFSAFFVIFNIHLIRQSVAITMILVSFIYLYKKNYAVFILLALLAANFHKSALIVLPFSILIMLKLTKVTRLVIFGIAVISYIIFTFFKDEVFIVLSLIPVTRRFAEVYNNLQYSSGYGISMGLLFDIVLFLFINSRKNLTQKQMFLLNVFLCSIFISVAFNSFSVALRLGYYFRIVGVFLFVSLINIKPKFVFYIFLITYTGYYLHNNLYKGHAVLEYKALWEKQYDIKIKK